LVIFESVHLGDIINIHKICRRPPFGQSGRTSPYVINMRSTSRKKNNICWNKPPNPLRNTSQTL